MVRYWVNGAGRCWRELRLHLSEPLATWLWLTVFAAATLALSALMHHGVERPGRQLGRRLARKVDSWSAASSRRVASAEPVVRNLQEY